MATFYHFNINWVDICYILIFMTNALNKINIQLKWNWLNGLNVVDGIWLMHNHNNVVFLSYIIISIHLYKLVLPKIGEKKCSRSTWTDQPILPSLTSTFGQPKTMFLLGHDSQDYLYYTYLFFNPCKRCLCKRFSPVTSCVCKSLIVLKILKSNKPTNGENKLYEISKNLE